MALFALWRDDPADRVPAADYHRRLSDAAHIAPERVTASAIETRNGRWQIAAFAVATRFFTARQQVWIDDAGGACLIHGLPWRNAGGRISPLDAQDIASLLDHPGQVLPNDIGGEYAIARLFPCGSLLSFADPAGLHQLFERPGRSDMIASRAVFLAILGQDKTPEPESACWISATGYRVGTATGWRNVRQISQGFAWRDGKLERGPALYELSADRGLGACSESELHAGIDEAVALAALGTTHDEIQLPVTGGKDSRAVLAICLAAGLRDRLTLVTRGVDRHPDVVAARLIAERLGRPHRLLPPRQTAMESVWSVDRFRTNIARLAFQADGAMGGWDMVAVPAVGGETTITGHMGEVLKTYAKSAEIPPRLDPAGMIGLRGPFDPLALLHTEARSAMIATLEGQMDDERRAGAAEADLPDLFYLRNRVPNWLGGIRAIESSHRQPVLPLGVPALQRLAFRLTAEERQEERLHHMLVGRLAPELIDLPFAHQRWHPALGVPPRDPLIAPAELPLFGNWQFSINRNTAIRAYLADLAGRTDAALWDRIDRKRVINTLREARLDYFGSISILGLAVSLFHASGLVLPEQIRKEATAEHSARPALHTPYPGSPPVSRLRGHIDSCEGAALLVAPDRLRRTEGETCAIGGWLQSIDWPGAQPLIQARVGGRIVASTAADRMRSDLRDAGIGHGGYGFLLTLKADDLLPGSTVELISADGASFEGGRLEIEA